VSERLIEEEFRGQSRGPEESRGGNKEKVPRRLGC